MCDNVKKNGHHKLYFVICKIPKNCLLISVDLFHSRDYELQRHISPLLFFRSKIVICYVVADILQNSDAIF
jgi:hypothetical protein